jgi:glycerol-3-phosphate acyltransferase PlsY
MAAAVWGAAVWLTRTSSIASLSAVSFAAVAAFVAPMLGFESYVPLFVPLLAIQVIVVIKHEANIKRLFSGQEPKIGASKAGGKKAHDR